MREQFHSILHSMNGSDAKDLHIFKQFFKLLFNKDFSCNHLIDFFECFNRSFYFPMNLFYNKS